MSESAGIRVEQLARKVRVLIADDHPVIRRIVRSTLQAHPHFEVCGEVENGLEAIQEATALKPDVVVLNISMPVLNGFEAAREIKKTLPESAIVILSQNADRRFVEEAKELGVRAYVVKTKAGEALVKAVEGAVLGDDFLLVD
jgi:two-component system, NarL family, nitrate/nitrite response regulator NarL